MRYTISTMDIFASLRKLFADDDERPSAAPANHSLGERIAAKQSAAVPSTKVRTTPTRRDFPNLTSDLAPTPIGRVPTYVYDTLYAAHPAPRANNSLLEGAVNPLFQIAGGRPLFDLNEMETSPVQSRFKRR